MNKQELNNEIILCRPAVRKAKVIVIRKIIKKMKILKSCKNESMKEKKLKKSERLFKKVQLMKKVKLDDVTKFALRNSRLDGYLQGHKIHLKENVLACLAKHQAVASKIMAIRERFQNWETELPLLLNSLGKKKNVAKKQHAVKNTDKPPKQSDKDNKNERNSVIDTQKMPSVNMPEKTLAKPDIKTPKNFKNDDTDKKECTVKNSEKSSVEDVFSISVKPKKVDDPFFIEKKVIQPKLHEESSSSGKSTKEVKRAKSQNATSIFHEKPFKMKKTLEPFRTQNPKPAEDQLHPSWAAKKVKLIRPFEGKKIVFSEE